MKYTSVAHTILNHITEAFIFIDRLYTLLFINRAAEKLWKIDGQQFTGTSIYTQLKEYMGSEGIEIIYKVVSAGNTFEYSLLSVPANKWLRVYVQSFEEDIILRFQEELPGFYKRIGSTANPAIFERDRHETVQQSLSSAATHTSAGSRPEVLDKNISDPDTGVFLAAKPAYSFHENQSDPLKDVLIQKHIEEKALTGQWYYNLQTEVLSWSDSMYRLFGMSPGCSISPDIFTQYADKSSKAAVNRMIRAMLKKPEAFSETLSVCVNETSRIIHFKASVMNDERGDPLFIIGVAMDITTAKGIALQQKNMLLREERRKLEDLQQKKIFKAILNTQEEERRRIAELLHNEIGQLLSLAQFQLSTASPQETRQLLNEAIKKVRVISFELMPAVLQDFGLERALRDMAEKKLAAEGIRYQLTVDIPKSALNNSLEIIIFRIVQELLNNIVKHAAAGSVKIAVYCRQDNLFIQVADDGKGIGAAVKNSGEGFGLKSIQSRVKLINGKFSLQSEPGKGTRVAIQVPDCSSDNTI